MPALLPHGMHRPVARRQPAEQIALVSAMSDQPHLTPLRANRTKASMSMSHPTGGAACAILSDPQRASGAQPEQHADVASSPPTVQWSHDPRVP